MFGTGYERVWGISTKEASWKSAFLSLWYVDEVELGQYSRGARELVPLYTRPPRIAGISNCPPALWLWPNLDLEKLVSLVTERSCNKSAFLLVGFFFSFLTSFWINTVVKKRLPGKMHKYQGGWITNQTCRRYSQFATGVPKSRPQVQGTVGEGLHHTVLTYWGQTKHGPKRGLPILCHPCPHPFCVYVCEDHDI